MMSSIISAILQVLLFSLIPLIVYLIRKKKFTGFFEYTGLKRSTKKANFLAFLVMILIAFPIILLAAFNEDFKAIMTNPQSVSGSIRQMGLSAGAIITILFTAILKTALAEEIFFRGFIAKRFIAITGFKTGNLIQAVLFGLIHSLLFYTITKNLWFLIIIFVFPAIGSYIKVYLNEKLANGSIIPGWIAHASANLVSYSYIAFLI